MADEPFILFVSIDGRLELPELLPPSDLKPGFESESELVEFLNAQHSDAIAERVEREVKRLLPPQLTVQANIQFGQGSLIISGTVAILSWAGSIVLDAASDEIRQELANLVKLATQRVMNRFFQELIIPTTEMTLDAYSYTSGTRTGNLADERSSSKLGSIPSSITFLYVITGVIFVTQILLLLDRFFVIQFR